MQRNKIILVSALMILVFALLFITEKPKKIPKSEIDHVINRYKGNNGFIILSMPRFLISDVLFNGKLKSIEKDNSVQSVDMMIFHENKSNKYSSGFILKTIDSGLRSLNFEKIDSIKSEYTARYIFNKEKENNWNESVLLFNNDSSVFLFDIITNLTDREIVAIADSINTNEISFD